MKRRRIPEIPLFYLVTGLFLVALAPVLSRHCGMPDMLRGFLTGLGMMLEIIAIIKIQRSRRSRSKDC